MSEKLDYKKEYKDLYMPKKKPVLIQVPAMNFIMVDGHGAPSQEEYQSALSALYALSFTIKMSKMSGSQPEGYFEYVVPPLEGLWWSPDGKENIMESPKEDWNWTSMIRQPEFVTKEVFEWAVEECRKKKPEVDISKARFETYEEGQCVQIMHIGSYEEELPDIEAMHRYANEQGKEVYTDDTHRHHEIYLSDPRRTAVDKLKTVVRHPVRDIT